MESKWWPKGHGTGAMICWWTFPYLKNTAFKLFFFCGYFSISDDPLCIDFAIFSPNSEDKSHSMHVNCLSKRKVANRKPSKFIIGLRFNLLLNRFRWELLWEESSKGKFFGRRVRRWLSLFYFRHIEKC